MYTVSSFLRENLIASLDVFFYLPCCPNLCRVYSSCYLQRCQSQPWMQTVSFANYFLIYFNFFWLVTTLQRRHRAKTGLHGDTNFISVFCDCLPFTTSLLVTNVVFTFYRIWELLGCKNSVQTFIRTQDLKVRFFVHTMIFFISLKIRV